MFYWRFNNFNIFNPCCCGLNFMPQRSYYSPAPMQSNIFEYYYNSYNPNGEDENYENCENNEVRPSVIKVPTNEKNVEEQQISGTAAETKDIIPKSIGGKKINKDVLARVKTMAKNLNCDYKDLLAVINSESNFNTKAGYNSKTGKIGGAVGLLQFTQSAINELNKTYDLNLTKEKILNMSAIEQLDLAEKYLIKAKSLGFKKGAKLSAKDLYAITFLPGRANKEILCTAGERNSVGKLLNYYEANMGLDINGDGKITKTELAQRINNNRVDESIFA